MKVSVRQRHIAFSPPQHPELCPIARALMDLGWTNISVGAFNVTMQMPNSKQWYLYLLPEKARNFIRDFDAGQPVEPFEFEMNLCSSS